ncbi:MAG TPA: porin family protein [Chitinophagaceae bacterium]|nr:porin family protein [Chitinophagaceae bacterium]
MKIFFSTLALFVSMVTMAQFQFGAKAGVNISNFTGGSFDDVDKKALVGFHGGVYMRFQIANFSIQPEAMVSTQGAKIDSASGSYDWKLTYINIPVMAQYRFPAGFYLEAGPQVGFKIDDQIENETIKNFVNELDLSLAAGLGYRGAKGLGIGARYTAGLSKVGDFDQSVNGIDPDFKNGVIQVSVYIPLTR